MLLGYDGPDATVGIPVFLSRRLGFRLVLSPPRGYGIPFLGPLFRIRTAERELTRYLRGREFVKAFLSDARIGRTSIAHLSLGPWLVDVRPYLDAGFQVRPRYTYYLDLAGGHDALRAGMHKRLRNRLKGEASRFTIREGSPDDVEWVLDSVHARYEEKGREMRVPRDYLAHLARALPTGVLRTFVAESDGRLASGSVCLNHRGTLFGWLGMHRPDPSHPFANEVLLDGILSWASSSGYARFDLMGANTPGVAHFKTGFNPRLDTYADATRIPFPVRVVRDLARTRAG